MVRARYIALEGAEGSGKSSQATRLAADLDAVLTRETGGTRIGVRIRDILHDTANTDLAHRAEALLTAADRAQHLQQVVLPALAGGRDVISDRSLYSALAYQGYGRELDAGELRRINDWAVGGRWPDLVILLEVADEVLAARMRGRDLDRFERESSEFHARVLTGFRAMASSEPERWAVVDGNGTPDQVAAAIRAVVEARCPR
jgi:dTMP kinase